MSIWKNNRPDKLQHEYDPRVNTCDEVISYNADVNKIKSGWIGVYLKHTPIPWHKQDHKGRIKQKIIHKPMVYYLPNETICPLCRINNVESHHHILPRKYGGQEFYENMIYLCYKCHDYVEIKTEDWIKSGKHYDIDILKMLILNDGF